MQKCQIVIKNSVLKGLKRDLLKCGLTTIFWANGPGGRQQLK